MSGSKNIIILLLILGLPLLAYSQMYYAGKVYFVLKINEKAYVAPFFRELDIDSEIPYPVQMLHALQKGLTQEETLAGLRNYVYPEFRINSYHTKYRTAFIDISASIFDRFKEKFEEDCFISQVVYTLTDENIRKVKFSINGNMKFKSKFGRDYSKIYSRSKVPLRLKKGKNPKKLLKEYLLNQIINSSDTHQKLLLERIFYKF